MGLRDIASVAANTVEELGEILGRRWQPKENRVSPLMIRIIGCTKLKSQGDNCLNKVLRVCKGGEDDNVQVLIVAREQYNIVFRSSHCS
jgi:hypothetical protein